MTLVHYFILWDTSYCTVSISTFSDVFLFFLLLLSLFHTLFFGGPQLSWPWPKLTTCASLRGYFKGICTFFDSPLLKAGCSFSSAWSSAWVVAQVCRRESRMGILCYFWGRVTESKVVSTWLSLLGHTHRSLQPPWEMPRSPKPPCCGTLWQGHTNIERSGLGTQVFSAEQVGLPIDHDVCVTTTSGLPDHSSTPLLPREQRWAVSTNVPPDCRFMSNINCQQINQWRAGWLVAQQ